VNAERKWFLDILLRLTTNKGKEEYQKDKDKGQWLVNSKKDQLQIAERMGCFREGMKRLGTSFFSGNLN